MNPGYLSLIVLAAVMGAVLLLPFSFKKAEEELEIFLFIMGLVAVTVSGLWSRRLLADTLLAPAPIAVAVFLAGLVFRAARPHVRSAVHRTVQRFGLRPAVAGCIFALGLVSSLSTAVIAALVWTDVAGALLLDRAGKVRLTVCACFAIGLGSILTPLGGPLSAIVSAQLQGPPHPADFLFLARLLAWWVVPGVALTAVWAAVGPGAAALALEACPEIQPEAGAQIAARAGKIYIFVAGLTLLGAGLAPVAAAWVARLPEPALFWFNSVSAALDNATLAAVEISPDMTSRKLVFALLGLLISGGMLIPGNIPNIVCAAKLGIRSREWAAAAVPMGLAMMTGCFLLLMLLR